MMQQNVALFFQSIPDIAAMTIVEVICHNQEEGEEEGHLEDILEDAGYSYVGINSIVYLFKGDDTLADLDTDEYSWNKASEDFDPIAATFTLIEAIADNLKA